MRKILLFVLLILGATCYAEALLYIKNTIEFYPDEVFLIYLPNVDKEINGHQPPVVVADNNIDKYADFQRNDGDYVINVECRLRGKEWTENLIQIIFNKYVGYVASSGQCLTTSGRRFMPLYEEGNIFTVKEVVFPTK
jgi:hypothetical protein